MSDCPDKTGRSVVVPRSVFPSQRFHGAAALCFDKQRRCRITASRDRPINSAHHYAQRDRCLSPTTTSAKQYRSACSPAVTSPGVDVSGASCGDAQSHVPCGERRAPASRRLPAAVLRPLPARTVSTRKRSIARPQSSSLLSLPPPVSKIHDPRRPL